MTNVIKERFDFSASICGWDINTQRIMWKLIALLVIESGSSLEEKILSLIAQLQRESVEHEKQFGPGSCNNMNPYKD